MIPRGFLWALLAAAVLLPIAVMLLVATSLLFAGLQDVAVARALNGGAFVLGLLWVLDLVALVLALTVEAISRSRGSERPTNDE